LNENEAKPVISRGPLRNAMICWGNPLWLPLFEVFPFKYSYPDSVE